MTREEIETLIVDAQRQVGEALRARLEESAERRLSIDEIEALVEEVGREVDSRLEQALIEGHHESAGNIAPCPECGQSCRYKDRHETNLLTTHGERSLACRYYYCSACECGFYPAHAALGLERGRRATRQVRAWQAKYGSESAFASVPELFQELRGIEVSASTVERTTIEVGEQLRTGSPAVPPPVETTGAAEEATVSAEGQRLYLSMDGTMCPLRDPWKRDGSRGKLVCRYGEAKLGIAFQTRQRDGLDTEVVRRGCVGTLGDLGAFLPLLLMLARQWRLPAARELIVLGDGAVWIWALVAVHFAHAIQILDFWHMTEHLWKVARAMHGSGTEAAQAWVKQAQWDLKHDLTRSFLVSLREWSPESAEAREVRRIELAFFEENAERMRYGTFLAKGYMIGSGVMESGCRQLVGQRLDQAGMHWREETADAVLAIRTHRRSTGAPPLTQYA